MATSTIVNLATSTQPASLQSVVKDLATTSQDILKVVLSPKLQHDLIVIKILFIVFSAFCLVAIIYLYKKLGICI